MDKSSSHGKLRSSILRGIIVVLAAAASAFVFFRQFFLSAGKMVVGDVADGRLILSIHEHWYRFLQGKEGFFELSFFYPEKNVLGYSDTFFLPGILHSLFRSTGLDMFLSFQLVQITLFAVGFFGMYLWLTRCRQFPLPFALFGTVVFSLASPVFTGSAHSHIQLQAVWLVPWVFILIERVWTEAEAAPDRLLTSFTLLALLYGGLVYSTFYIGWFFLLFAVIWIITAIFLSGWRECLQLVKARWASWPRLIPGMLILLTWLALFLRTYLPVRQEHGGRSVGAAIEKLPAPWEFINHSHVNLLWGKISSVLYKNPNWGVEIGPTFFFTLLVIIFSIGLLRRRFPWTTKSDQLIRITGLAVMVAFLLITRVWLLSLWVFPHLLIPGGDGIRVPQRLVILLMVPMSWLLVFGMYRLKQALPHPFAGWIIALLGTLVLIEQIQVRSIANIDREEQLATLASLPPPPEDAIAFFGYGNPEWSGQRDIFQNSSIIYSQYWDLPTVGGRSGFVPKNWHLMEIDLEESLLGLIRWGNLKNLQGKVYLFNLEMLEWGQAIPFPKPLESVDRDEVNLLELENFYSIAGQGWSRPEPWGVWNDGQRAVLTFPPIEEDSSMIKLDMGLQAFTHEKKPRQRLVIRLNGEEIYRDTFTQEKWRADFAYVIPFETAARGFELEFIMEDAEKPIDMGIFPDTRALGVGLSRLVLERY